MRLAWFSPWPPDRSGVAGRSAEVVPALALRGHAIDVFVDESRVPVGRGDNDPPRPGCVRVESAHDFVWRAARGQFDLAVYQIGNSRLHEFIWPYACRWPGLAVLHDARLHHARGRARLTYRDAAAYRAEFAWNAPSTSPDAAELAIAGFDGVYYYAWPMLRLIVESSRLVAAHSAAAAAEIADRWPAAPLDHVTLGEGALEPPSPAAREDVRRALGFSPGAIVFGVFGALSPEKRLDPILRAFSRTRARVPAARLLLAGAITAPDIERALGALGPDDGVTILGSLDDAAFDRAIAAVDVSLNLRWPTARETSGPWLRALAAGRAAVMTDLAQYLDVPVLDPRTWQPADPTNGAPIAVAIDILDEDHSLDLAMRRLATDAALRDALGRAARAYWEARHTLAHMVDDYDRVLARAATMPRPAGARPAALDPQPWRDARRLLDEMGVPCELC